MPPRRFVYAPRNADPETTIFVDGSEPGFRSLSHWPGNSTPAELKRDLSTGIALAFAKLPASKQQGLIGPFERVANNHYDTDGVLSAFAVLRPEAALPHEQLMLRAAACGDFGTWQGPEALAVELAVMVLPSHPKSPIARTSNRCLNGDAYEWWLSRLPETLSEPFATQELWAARHAAILDDIARVEARRGVEVQRCPELGLAVVISDHALTRIGLNHAAGDCHRVLLVRPGEGSDRTMKQHRYRFMDRAESWFELPDRSVPARVPLEALAEQLAHREGPGAAPAQWYCSSLDLPVAQLGFGNPEQCGDGFSEGLGPGADPTSRLSLEEVVSCVRSHFRTRAN
jgi:hypothetical protein